MPLGIKVGLVPGDIVLDGGHMGHTTNVIYYQTLVGGDFVLQQDSAPVHFVCNTVLVFNRATLH